MNALFKKIVAAMLAVLMLISAMSPMVFANEQQAQEYEYLVLTLGEEAEASIEEEGQYAYFSFTPTESGTYFFASHSDYDTYGYFYDDQMNEVLWNDDGGENQNFSIMTTFEAGRTYYFGAKFLNVEETGTFSVSIRKARGIRDIILEPLEIIEGTNCSVNQTEGESGVIKTFYYYDWCSQMNYTVIFDDESSAVGSGLSFADNEGNNYAFSYSDDQSQTNQWEVGNTYYPTISFMGQETTVPVKIVETPISEIIFEPIEIVKGTQQSICEGWDEEKQENYTYRYYSWENLLSYIIKFKNSSTIEGSGTSVYDEDENCLGYISCTDDQSLTNQWEVGNTYYPTISFMGYETTVAVKIVETPISEMIFEPIEIVKGTRQNTSWGWDEEKQEEVKYLYYDWNDLLSYTIKFKDSSTIEGSGTSVYDEDENCLGYISCTDDQSLTNQWEVGNTYYPTISFMGYETTVAVKIVETPISEIIFEPIEIIEGTKQNTRWEWDEEKQEDVAYRHYDWHEILSYTIKFKDSSIIKGTGYLVHDEEGNHLGHIDGNDDQSRTNQWEVGNTYYPTISFMGYETTVPVKIVETPIESIIFDEEIEIVENTSGGISTVWNDDNERIEYFEYLWLYNRSYTIKFKDSSTIKGCGNYVYDEEGNYLGYIDCSDDQSYDNLWTKGNTYYPTISFMGYETTVPVKIVETPVTSVSFDPVIVIENTNGHMNSGWDEDQNEHTYFHYNWTNKLNFTIYLKDGTTIEGTNGEYRDENGQYHSIEISDGQGYDNAWSVGNYTAKAFFMGYEAEVPVTIIENPIRGISVAPIYLDAQQDYDICHEYDEEENVHEYRRYNWEDKAEITLTLSDGSTMKLTDRGFTYHGEYFYAELRATQCYDLQWVPGNTYFGTARMGALSCEFEIHVMESKTEAGITYLDVGEGVIITSVEGEGETLVLPSMIDEKQVIGVSSLGSCGYEEVVFPDSVTSVSTGVLDRCTALKKVTFGAGMTSLSQGIVCECPYLEEIDVSAENPEYCAVDGVLYDKEKTTMIAIPPNKKTAHTVPETAEDIELYFQDSGMFNIILQNDASGYIKEDGVIYNADKTIVYGCDKDKEGTYIMPDSVQSIDSCAFAYSSFGKVVVSSNVTAIVYGAFEHNANLEEIVLPTGLKSIGYRAFSECESLSKISLPDGLEAIDDKAFTECSRLESINLPDSLEYLGTEAFAFSALKSIHIPAKIKIVEAGAFEGTPLTQLTFSEGVCGISSYAFRNTKLKKFTLPASMNFISYQAFYNTPLESIDFRNVFSIGAGSFAKTNLTEVNIPATLTEIDGFAFDGCKAQKLNFAKGVTTIGRYSFGGMAMDSVRFPETVTDIGYYSFSNCGNLSNIDLPDSLERLDGTAFSGTAWYKAQENGMVYLENALYEYKGTVPNNSYLGIKNNTKIVASYAFDNQKNLKKIYIPKSVKNIGYGAFFVTGLTDVYYEGSPADYDKMEIGEANSELLDATWHYNYTCTHKYTDDGDTTCDICGATRTAPKCTHAKVSATTNACNTVRITVCATCGKELKRESLSEANAKHKAGSLITDTAATCGKVGKGHKNCTVCGALVVSNIIINATGKHVAGGWKTTKAATYEAEGLDTKYCITCNKVMETKIVAKLIKATTVFKDVKADDWYHDAVSYAYSNNLFNGVSENDFAPAQEMTRAMLVTVLWRYAGKPAGGSHSFKDVPKGEWYTEAVAWAAKTGVVNGTSAVTFDPNATITREQMATILYRYAKSTGLNVSGSANISGFKDGSKVNDWAKEGMQWAVGKKLINGSSIDGIVLLDPSNGATRGQVATILMRYIENIVKA